MKKSVFLLACLALLAAGCNKVQVVEEPVQEESSRHLKVNISVNYGDETRAVKTGWAAGDKVYVAFDICFQNELSSYLTLTYDGSTWSSEFSDDELEGLLEEKGSGKLAAAYLSAGRVPEFQYVDPGSNSNRWLTMTNNEGLTGFYLSAFQVPYSVEDGTLTAELNMQLSLEYTLHFFLNDISEADAANYTLRCAKLQPCHFNRFTYVYLDIPDVLHLEFGPYTDCEAGSYGEPIVGSYYEGGVEYVALLDNTLLNQETEYVFFIVDDKGTSDTSDDITYSLTKTVTFKGKEAIKFPFLSDDAKWKILTPSTVSPVFDGLNEEVTW